MDARDTLQKRLAVEFDDAEFAHAVVARLADEHVASIVAMSGSSISTCPSLSYRPPTVALDEIDAIVAFSYGYRLDPEWDSDAGDVPPIGAITPGPVNERLADSVAAALHRRAVPVLAQWEIAVLLDDLAVADVVPIEPDVGADGSTVYLSTAGVTAKGLTLAAETGHRPERVGVVAHLDHAPRCVATARASGLVAGVITGVDLPEAYDQRSGQRWTRDRITWVATDLVARTQLGDANDWSPPT